VSREIIRQGLAPQVIINYSDGTLGIIDDAEVTLFSDKTVQVVKSGFEMTLVSIPVEITWTVPAAPEVGPDGPSKVISIVRPQG
jgi:hypothetical protein